MDIIFDPQMSFGDMHALDKFAGQVRPNLALEVGSWKGLSSWIIAKYSGNLICVDTWKAAPSTPHMQAEAVSRDVFSVFMDNMRAVGVAHKITPMRMDSMAALAHVPDGTIDMLFIDANHAYSSVSRDIKAWLPKVRKGGILCGHDCEIFWKDCTNGLRQDIDRLKETDFMLDAVEPGCGIHPGVTMAIHEIFDDKVNLLYDSSIWWVQL